MLLRQIVPTRSIWVGFICSSLGAANTGGTGKQYKTNGKSTKHNGKVRNHEEIRGKFTQKAVDFLRESRKI